MGTTTIHFPIEKTTQSRLSQTNFDQLEFGAVNSDHMFVADYVNGEWTSMKIIPFQSISVSPACSALHYAQMVFEGMKAYRASNGDLLVFRPEKHLERINNSNRRMCMPELPSSFFFEAIDQLVHLDQDWIPRKEGCSLYLRPFIFATDPYIGVKPSATYKFIIFTCPVAGYYKGTVNVVVESKFVRAAEGGVGEAKTGGNYAASLLPAKLAADKGYHQILWTDSKEHEFFEESGTMNLMFVINDTLITPPLGGSILPGITRDCILTIARDWGVKVEERKIGIKEIVNAYQNGSLQDAFGTGTAATITHIAKIHHNGADYTLPASEDRVLSNKLNQYLLDIKHGVAEDKFGWVHRINL
ncbi:MAG: branched-chain amino acid aminotransferase [Cytophagaceae bacterium]|nr:branched-chain amino acid aminotransferase [Cytophagaceae bacterium]